MRGRTRKVVDEDFIRKLVRYHIMLKRIKARQIYVFNVIANYGSYQIVVGPEYSVEECRSRRLRPHSRPIEINGSMHHLFVNPKRVSALPAHEDVKSNLRGSVIMKDIVVHIVDRDGCGTSVRIEKLDRDGVQARQWINLAGQDGDAMIEKHKSSGFLAIETYKIIQEDILKALKVHR